MYYDFLYKWKTFAVKNYLYINTSFKKKYSCENYMLKKCFYSLFTLSKKVWAVYCVERRKTFINRLGRLIVY